MFCLLRRGNPGLTLAEVIMATGFLAIFTTGLLAIATKAFQMSEQQVDMASVYQHGERLMEDVTLESQSTDGWPGTQSELTPVFTTYVDDAGNDVEDRRFVRTVEIEELAPDLKFATVKIYHADPAQAEAGTPAIDTSAPRGGLVLDFVNLLQRLQ